MKWLLLTLVAFSVFADTCGVFCATDEQVPELYKTQAFELGKALQKGGYGLMTGGANTGLMNAVVNGFVSEKEPQHLWGVLPSVFKTYNVHHSKIPSLIGNLLQINEFGQ